MQADVVVVGAGLIGASVARHLARTHSVLLVEQGALAGAEASAQNASMVRRLVRDPVERALALRSAEALAALPASWSDAPPFRAVGGLVTLAEEDAILDEAAADLIRRGVQAERLTGDALATVAPALAGTELHHGWHVPGDGVADPHALVQGFLRDARDAGARLLCEAAVTKVCVQAGRVTGAMLADGSEIRAERVVLAAGAWSGRIASDLGPVRPLKALRRHLLLSAPHPLATREHPWCWLEQAGIYVRPETSAWLCSPCDEVEDMPPPGSGSIGPVDPYARAVATDKLARHLPALADLRWARGWTGLRTFAPDRRPLLGADGELDGLWWATGFGGFGVTCCFAAGEALAALLRGEPLDWIDAEALRPDRFAARS